MPSSRGNRPLCASGTRFITHKVGALSCIIDRFGAYLSHLQTLITDSATKCADKAKLTGYIRKWREGKMIMACALFHDILKLGSTLCKVLQSDEVCIISAFKSVVRTVRAIETLESIPLEELPTVKKVISRITHSGHASSYQAVELVNYENGLQYLRNNQQAITKSVVTCLKSRIKSQHANLLNSCITILVTQGWEKIDATDFADDHIEFILAS